MNSSCAEVQVVVGENIPETTYLKKILLLIPFVATITNVLKKNWKHLFSA